MASGRPRDGPTPVTRGGHRVGVAGVRQSPREIPRSRAVAIVSESSGTVFGAASASSIEIGAIVGGRSATMVPNFPSAMTRSEEHTSDSSHGYISYAVFCLKKKKQIPHNRAAVVFCTNHDYDQQHTH